MEPHSRPGLFRNGTLHLPQVPLAASPSVPVTQTASDLNVWYGQSIKQSTHRLLRFLNPFVVSGGRLTLTFVGMLQLTALCGFASLLWSRSKASNKGNAINTQNVSDTVAGKCPEELATLVDTHPITWLS
jgi:hypothetical protein